MTFKIADDSIQWLIKNGEIYKELFNKSPELNVFFFGGEPTLKWDDIIVPIVEKYPNLKYSITTNGYLLNKEKIDFLNKHNFAVMLSMDGAEQTQNYNRKDNSFNQLDKIIPYFLKKISYNNFRGTIIPATCENTFKNILYAQKKGFNKCYFTINIFEKWDKEDKNKLELEIKKYMLAYINSYVNNYEIINFTPFTEMINLIIKKEFNLLDNKINAFKCGFGNGYGAIDYKGDIFTCQEVVTDNNHNELFKIGNIYSGIDFSKIENLKNIIINETPVKNNENNECEKCPLSFCCKKNICQVNNYICNENCLIQSYNQCWWNLLLYKAASLSISILQDLPNFQNYMKNIIEKEV
jgi:uncharacterized protein